MGQNVQKCCEVRLLGDAGVWGGRAWGWGGLLAGGGIVGCRSVGRVVVEGPGLGSHTLRTTLDKFDQRLGI